MPDVRMPDGTIIRNVPANATKEQILAAHGRAREAGAVPDTRPTSYWQGLVEGTHKVANNVIRAGDNANPIMWAYDKAMAALGHPQPSMADITDKAFHEARAKSDYQGSNAGKITGNIISTVPAVLATKNPWVSGAISGGMMTDKRDLGGIAGDMAIGAVGGKLGDVVGKRVIAPIAAKTIAPLVRKATPVVRKMMGGGVADAVGSSPFALSPDPVSTTEKSLVRMSPDMQQMTTNLTDAQRLGLPYSLADASPKTRILAGSVSRKSPDARQIAEDAFGPRALGQADRAVQAIDTYLAPVTNIEQRAAAIKTAAQDASRPFYDTAKARAAPVDEELAAMLQRPAAKQALTDAYTTAKNSGIDPEKIGFNLNNQGEVVLQNAPSFETLQLTKRALDSQLEPARNQITGRLNLEGRPDLQAVDGLRRDLNNRMGFLNKDYAAGNEAYAQQISRRDAMNLGQDMARNNIPQRQFATGLDRMGGNTLPEFQRGFATSMADQADKMRMSGNPYNAVYGSPLQQGKVAAAFPQGAEDFGRIANLEGDMSKTAYETIGGSPTQARNMTDQLFDQNIVGNMASGIASPKTAITKAILKKIVDQARTGGEKKAAAMAPVLFDINPANALEYLNNIAQQKAQRQAQQAAYGRLFGSMGAAGMIGLAPLSQ
jgi:hypothetical protein